MGWYRWRAVVGGADILGQYKRHITRLSSIESQPKKIVVVVVVEVRVVVFVLVVIIIGHQNIISDILLLFLF